MISIFTLSQVLLLLVWISSWTEAQSCGRLNSCDKLISHSIFQKGSCGRLARCSWERLHFEKALKGDNSKQATYEGAIKDALCDIPTLATYKAFTKRTFNPCGIIAEPGATGKWESEPFNFYPMPTPFVVREGDNEGRYLNRVGRCQVKEEDCNKELQILINDTCSKLDQAAMEKLEKAFPMLLRGKQYYQLAHIHPELQGQTIDVDYKFQRNYTHEKTRYFPNPCSIFHSMRQRYDSSDTNGIPKYVDEHRPNSIYPRLRGPYFDLHLLYKADPDGHFQQIPEEDRWWNETKAYQELAHYLPSDMLEDIHKAINCVYERVDSPEMEWKPEKFCWGYSTFVCVEDAKLNTNNCGGNVGTDQRHEDANTLFKFRP